MGYLWEYLFSVTHRFPIVCGGNSWIKWIWYGTDMKRSHSIPISHVSMPNTMGHYQMVLVWVQTDTIPKSDAMENVWNFTKYVAIP